MSLAIGSKIPKITLKQLIDGSPKDVVTDELFAKKKVVVFGLPGAFTPTCSNKHLPGYVKQAEQFAGHGVDEIVCVSVNDAFVMQAWGDSQKVGGKIRMLADGNGDFARALGVEVDYSPYGMGKRMGRCAMLIENGVLKLLDVEPEGAYGVSDADAFVCKL
ncbi:MAG: peroxiredoxin [Candidatus Pacebacteria bacterium]|nr:peroxiredoxin [Candidatus Paceibacterota bacterium]